MNKKGAEELLWNVVYLTIIALVLIVFTAWLSGLATGKISNAQVLAKELALVIDAAEPETAIIILHEPLNLRIDDAKKEVSVLVGQSGFVYDYFSPYKVSAQGNETSTTITITK